MNVFENVIVLKPSFIVEFVLELSLMLQSHHLQLFLILNLQFGDLVGVGSLRLCLHLLKQFELFQALFLRQLLQRFIRLKLLLSLGLNSMVQLLEDFSQFRVLRNVGYRPLIHRFTDFQRSK